MSSANKQTALAAHRAPRKRPFHGRFRRPGARVFWAFQRGADFSASPIYLEFSAPHRFTFPACPDSSVFPACMASSTQHCFVFPAHPELSALHRASRKRSFHLHSRRPEAHVFWAFQRGGDFSTFPTHLEFSAHPEHSASHQAPCKRPFHLHSRRPGARVFWASPACPSFSASPLCPEFFTLPAYLKISAPHQTSRKRPFHERSRWPEPRVFWAFQRGGDFYALAAHPALDASGALFRSAVLCSKRPSFDQPFGAHAS